MPVACFLLFLVPEKAENQYSRNWTGQKPKCLFFRKGSSARIRDGEGPGSHHTTWPRCEAWPTLGGGVAAPSTPSASHSAYKMTSERKPWVPNQKSTNETVAAVISIPRSGGIWSSSRHPAGEGNSPWRPSSSPCKPPVWCVSSSSLDYGSM